MVGTRRNLWIALGLAAVLGFGAVVLPSALWACGLAAVLGLVGVVLFSGNRWRTGSLLLAAQFAKANDYKVRTVNLGVPGYGPNHLVRAFEAGLLDRYAGQSVKAVVSWIIPAHLARVTGDGSWLGSSPRYVLENGALRHT